MQQLLLLCSPYFLSSLFSPSLLLLLPLALLQRTTQYGSLAFYNFLLNPVDATATNISFESHTKQSLILSVDSPSEVFQKEQKFKN